MNNDGQNELDQAFDGLQDLVSPRLARAVQWLRSPSSRLARIPVAILLLVSSFLWFLPVLGIWMLPLGLLIIAQDVPFLRKPVGKSMLWAEGKWRDRKRRKANAVESSPVESRP
jgi:hypothetical protein